MSETKSFGAGTRQNHNSEKFYNSGFYDDIKKKEYSKDINPIEGNAFYLGDSSNMFQLPDNSVDIVITSPPYNVGKEYDKNYSLEQYLTMLHSVLLECERVLVYGGRLCINIANVGRKPYIPLNSYISSMCVNMGLLMRGEILWYKETGSNGCAWGSWMSATNPSLRDSHEYILVFSKGDFAKPKGENDITRDEFLEYTKSVWTFRPESARKIGHPAPFPIELPSRLIKLYSFKNDVVLDPFGGSGTTALAATMHNRRFVYYDIEENYLKMAQKRVENYLKP